VILQANGVTKVYRRGQREFAAVDGVTLEVGPGRLTAITGRSGSGKTTLVSMLAGLITPTSGHVTVDGRKYTAMSDAELSAQRASVVGYIMQGPSLLAHLTVLENVVLPLSLFAHRSPSTDEAMSVLERVGIAELADQRPSTLSGGEMRRATIARAVLGSPQVLIADEPTGDLDPLTAREITGILAQVAREGVGVLVVTHDPDVAEQADRHLVMESGRCR
jgi:putative ABC transport system ATP-binding protein